METVAFALQSEYGDQDPSKFQRPGSAYFRLAHFLPPWVFSDQKVLELGRERFLRKCLGHLHRNLRGKSKFQAQLDFIEAASKIEDTTGNSYLLYKNKLGKVPAARIDIALGGIRFFKPTPRNSIPTKLFDFKWSQICSFRISNKKFVLRQEDQPACRKLVFSCLSHKRARYLLMFITQTHIFDYHQQKMYKPPQNALLKNIATSKPAVENSVDEWSPKRMIILEDYARNNSNAEKEDDDVFFIDVSSSTLKTNNPASRALSVSTPKRPEVVDRLQVKIPRHTSMSAADQPDRPNGGLRTSPLAVPAIPQRPPVAQIPSKIPLAVLCE
ncbi:Oidioi.mRNA.OKI2018_I69.PAR.g11232.t1.cds [Oikopleura dioica]|uniref:Oidioi.mRNA.OKI2018_I69.PAR.g11232.t1.cds n=1 Tax=Oikopleura dioica TaxID=34765 RepID=A0ABN7RUU9_OIKDI|nr:Oidioi.mRNA.OKI2018_I69.PAR.g11232.t1.cds [Oikopleura dioica]